MRDQSAKDGIWWIRCRTKHGHCYCGATNEDGSETIGDCDTRPDHAAAATTRFRRSGDAPASLPIVYCICTCAERVKGSVIHSQVKLLVFDRCVLHCLSLSEIRYE